MSVIGRRSGGGGAADAGQARQSKDLLYVRGWLLWLLFAAMIGKRSGGGVPPAAGQARQSKDHPYVRGLLLWLLFAVAVLMLMLSIAAPHLGAHDDPECFKAQRVEPTDPVWAFYNYPSGQGDTTAAPESPVQLALLSDQATTLQFGRSESVRALDVNYRPAPASAAGQTAGAGTPPSLTKLLGNTPLQLDVSQFTRADGATLDHNLVKASATRIADDRVRVSLCVDRRDASKLGDPGTYRGTVSIIDPRVARTDLPVQIEAADPRWTFPLFLVLLSVVAATWVTWMVKEQKADSARFRPSEWFIWSGTAIGIISIVAGAAAAAGVYQARYLSSSTWGSAVSDYVALLTAGFVAFMGVTTSLHVAGLAQASWKARRDTEPPSAQQGVPAVRSPVTEPVARST